LRRVLILTEGQTEEGFIKRVIQPYLWQKDISLEPKIVTTKRVIGGADRKGGGDASKILADIRRLLGDSNAVAVTTFFDFYGFPASLPNTPANAYRDIDLLTQAVEQEVSNIRFKAYLQRHEFEAFLFVDPQTTAEVAMQPSQAKELLRQRNLFSNVEDINLDPTLAPSKRITSALGRYSKPLTGSLVTQRVGVDRLRAECPRFAIWLSWLASLSAAST
jgi:hypothetical protein